MAVRCLALSAHFNTVEGMEGGAEWLGLVRVSDNEWRLPVTNGVISGASALFGGCATAAAVVVARSIAPQPVVFAASHFGGLAPLGSTVTIRARVVSSGRTMTHVEIDGSADGKQSFLSRVTAGERPAQAAEGHWVSPPSVPSPGDCAPFAHPVHEGTWAERFEWRLAPATEKEGPASIWWVRPADGERPDPLVVACVLVDHVTYGVGRALGVPMGGLSVDNVVRVHRPATADWYLLLIAPEAIAGGFGFGSGRLYADGELVMSGTQSIVVNGWDWRLPEER